jgi:hypothetical protein
MRSLSLFIQGQRWVNALLEELVDALLHGVRLKDSI